MRCTCSFRNILDIFLKLANFKQKNKKCRLRNPTCHIKSYSDLTLINHLIPVGYFNINTNTCALTLTHTTLTYTLKNIDIHIGLSSVALFDQNRAGLNWN